MEIDRRRNGDAPEGGPDVAAWAAGFRARHNRAPAVLHLGNIANNAYLIARALNRGGIDSDVLAENYYHIMGSPEWEDADFDATGLDQDLPDWTTVDLGAFSRPRWFAQGPLAIAARYLAARRHGRSVEARAWWAALTAKRHLSCSRRLSSVRSWYHSRRPTVAAPAAGAPVSDDDPSGFVRRFAETFPDRPDRLTAADVAAWMPRAAAVEPLFHNYDVVHAYGIDPILPMFAGCRYVAFEHGTIRDIPFQSTAAGRLTALAYRLADEVVITNADNRVAAARLGLERYRFVPHPVNEDGPDPARVEALRRRLRETLAADFLVFHPSRQHWDEGYRDPSLEKGNDVFIRGFARFVRESGVKAGAVFVEWGRTVNESRRLIAECGIADRVLWIAPQPRKAMSRYVAATDVLADQFYLGAFGSITPQALHSRRPVLLKLDEAGHRWAFPELPPVLNASAPGEVASHLARMATDRAEAARLAEAGAAWYARYHSMAAVTRAIVAVYADTLARNGEPRRLRA